MLVQKVQHDIRVHITAEFDADSHTLTVGLIPQIGDAVDFLISDKLRDLLDQTRLVYHVRKFCHNDAVLAVLHRLNAGHRADSDFSASGPVCLIDSGGSKNRTSGRKIRSLDDRQKLLDIGSAVFQHLVINDLYHTVNNLAQIVRRNIGRHSDSDTGRTVD